MNITELAKQVGYPIQHPEWQKATEEFAALVEAAARADEREECAKVCDELHGLRHCHQSKRREGMKFEITIAVLLTIGASVWVAYLTQGGTA